MPSSRALCSAGLHYRERSGLLTHEAPGVGALKDYAAIGDGRSVALVTPDGTIGWWCVPNLDSPPLFDRLLDPEHGGFFQVCPIEDYAIERQYRTDSNVLESVFTTASGAVRLTEALNSTLAGRLPWCELARRVEGLSGTVTLRVEMTFGTRADTVSPWLQPNPNGCIFHVGPVLGLLRVTPNVHILSEQDRTIVAEMRVTAGERAIVAIVAGENEPLAAPRLEDIDARLDLTDEAWRTWAQGLRYAGPRREAVRRSALALKLLLFSPSGAVAAAATTSLPERIGGDKNFDYRYAWVRDATYTASAFLRLGVIPEAKAAFTWIVHRLGETGARVCYRLDGGPVPPVQALDLPGFQSSQPVVTGNLAANQHQHGIYGDVFEMAALFVGSGNILDGTSANVLSALADECADRWRQKDSGIWELADLQHYTMSKISAWQALARAVEMAEHGHLPSTCVPRWARERDRIVAWVGEHCWSQAKQSYTFYAGSERLDASLVLAARFGFDGTDRLSRTCDAIRRELGHGPFLYRYSGAEDEEGAFVACTFWLAEAYATLGRSVEAGRLVDEALEHLGGTGIFSEMVDVASGAFLGNLPQGLSHLALIHAVCSIDVDPRRPFPATKAQAR